MVFKKDLIKFKKKYKLLLIRKDIKKLKYVKTIKKYKILRANPCKNRPKSPIRGKAQKIKIALLLQSSTL